MAVPPYEEKIYNGIKKKIKNGKGVPSRLSISNLKKNGHPKDTSDTTMIELCREVGCICFMQENPNHSIYILPGTYEELENECIRAPKFNNLKSRYHIIKFL